MKVINNINQKYSKKAIWLHWITAILIMALFPMGKYIEDLDQIDKLLPLRIHVLLGFLILFLTIYRVYLLFREFRPEPLDTGSNFNNKLIQAIHNAFYFLLFIISFTGISTMVTTGYGDFLLSGDVKMIKPHDDSFPLEMHEVMATVIIILLVFHVVGVIKHKILTKENALKRML